MAFLSLVALELRLRQPLCRLIRRRLSACRAGQQPDAIQLILRVRNVAWRNHAGVGGVRLEDVEGLCERGLSPVRVARFLLCQGEVHERMTHQAMRRAQRLFPRLQCLMEMVGVGRERPAWMLVEERSLDGNGVEAGFPGGLRVLAAVGRGGEVLVQAEKSVCRRCEQIFFKSDRFVQGVSAFVLLAVPTELFGCLPKPSLVFQRRGSIGGGFVIAR
jgi:hypothetical protein